MVEEPDAVRIAGFHRVQRRRAGHHRDGVGVAGDHALLADDLDAREVRVAANVVGVRLGVDHVAQRPVLEQALAPAQGVSRLLRGVDHEHAVARGHEARIAAPEVNFGVHAFCYASHIRSTVRDAEQFDYQSLLGDLRWNYQVPRAVNKSEMYVRIPYEDESPSHIHVPRPSRREKDSQTLARAAFGLRGEPHARSGSGASRPSYPEA